MEGAFQIIKKGVYKMKFNVEKMQDSLLKVSAWVESNTVLQAIKNAFVRITPFTVVGSFSNLIQMQLDALIENRNINNYLLTSISQLFDYIGTATLGIVGLIVVLSAGYSLAA